MKYLKFASSLLLLVVLSYVLDTKLSVLIDSQAGNLPPLGKFLDPFHGFWKNADPVKPVSDQQLIIPGLQHPVSVYFDHEQIPHIFASDRYDLYFSQGYITARDRLWQMEFQTMAAAGRISEIIGSKALNYDRLQRRMGMVYGAEHSLESIMKDSVSREITEAYTAGINAWITRLKPEDYPLEYKLLDYKPEAWTNLKVALLQQSLASTLTGSTDARELTANLDKFGPAVINDLFPDFRFLESPVIPAGTPWNFKKLVTPPAPVYPPAPGNAVRAGSAAGAGSAHSSYFAAGDAAGVASATSPASTLPEQFSRLEGEHLDGIGSNNWALDGTKTADHHTLLANDPHLNLSLPSIWYQIQLSAPGINVCGVSLPGAPGVVIGFNEHIAWGVTNVGADVMDIYRLNWTNSRHEQYLYDGKELNVVKKVGKIRVRGGKVLTDTVRYTRFGPVVYESTNFTTPGSQIPADHAIRWVAHDSSNLVRSIFLLNTAGGYSDFTHALEYFSSPAQNFAYADDKGHIAQWVNGRFPLKWKDQGKFILDGSHKHDDWAGYIPHDQVPHVLDPPRHYIASANQSSTDSAYPYYLNWNFENTQRAMRINSLLAPMQQAAPDSMRHMQTDLYNTYASLILPDLLKSINRNRLSSLQLISLNKLEHWNYLNTADAIAPGLFDFWSKYLVIDIWDEFSGPGLQMPGRDRTIHLLLHEPASKWFDNTSTARIERKADIITASFMRSIDSLVKLDGADPDSWNWYKLKNTGVRHLLGIDAFSLLKLHLGGGSGIVDALTTKTGPSWRMVVEPGVTDKAFGVYPGGESGNPGSFYYDNLFDYWLKGRLYTLVFMKSEDDNQEIGSRIILNPVTK